LDLIIIIGFRTAPDPQLRYLKQSRPNRSLIMRRMSGLQNPLSAVSKNFSQLLYPAVIDAVRDRISQSDDGALGGAPESTTKISCASKLRAA
jgi:hypothetical protein